MGGPGCSRKHPGFPGLAGDSAAQLPNKPFEVPGCAVLWCEPGQGLHASHSFSLRDLKKNTFSLKSQCFLIKTRMCLVAANSIPHCIVGLVKDVAPLKKKGVTLVQILLASQTQHPSPTAHFPPLILFMLWLSKWWLTRV